MKVLLLFISLIVIVLLLLLGVSYYFFNYAIKRRSLKKQKKLKKHFGTIINNVPKDINKEDIIDELYYRKWFNETDKETLILNSFDNTKLTGYFLKNDSKDLVLLIHGYKSRADHMGYFAHFYYELGFNVFVADQRAHGKSEGTYIGMGYLEAKDYRLWINHLLKKLGDDLSIVIHGASMGAATTMLLINEDLPSQVKVLIEDCGYTRVNKVFANQLKTQYNLPSFPILNVTSLISKFKAGYFLSEASPIEAIKKNTLPILFIHGNKDDFVPFSMVYELYNTNPSPKEILVTEGVDHYNSFRYRNREYVEALNHFLNKYYFLK